MPLKPSRQTARWRLHALVGSFIAAVAAVAHADDGRSTAPATPLPRYPQECGACHLAYPPGLLPASSWQRLMSQLPQHFGSDASLDTATLNELSAWLERHAGRRQRVGTPPPPQDRITRSAWFLREHRRVPADTWTRASVKSPSNCTACHTRADQGDFDEDTVRIPR